MIKYTGKAKVITAVSSPYNINGNEGVSHRVRLLVEDEIYPCKATAEQVKRFQEFLGRTGTVTIEVNSKKENVSLAVADFVPEK